MSTEARRASTPPRPAVPPHPEQPPAAGPPPEGTREAAEPAGGTATDGVTAPDRAAVPRTDDDTAPHRPPAAPAARPDSRSAPTDAGFFRRAPKDRPGNGTVPPSRPEGGL
ncbi:hypothetical protein ABZ713_40550, partial [Streptomyces sp. NPDC006875]